MVFDTKKLGIACYSGLAALLIVKDVVTTEAQITGLLAPLALFIGVQVAKHYHDKPTV